MNSHPHLSRRANVSRHTDFYCVGGTVPVDSASYVARTADEELFHYLLAGELCYILSSRQVGKSSLMVRTQKRLRKAGLIALKIDLQASGSTATAEQWYRGLVEQLEGELEKYTAEEYTEEKYIEDCPLAELLQTIWQQKAGLPPVQRFLLVLTGLATALPREQSLVLFIDEIDRVRTFAFNTDDLFAAIRSQYNARASDPEQRRATFCLIGAAAPASLIRDHEANAFNIGRFIALTDFTFEEAAPLATGLLPRRDEAGSVPNPEALILLRHILYWTAGQPYLTQVLCDYTASRFASEERLLPDGRSVARFCRELFFDVGQRSSADNLDYVRDSLLRTDLSRAALFERYRQILKGKYVADDPTDPYLVQLKLSGIVVENRRMGGRLMVRNPIYATLFNKRWMRENRLPEEERRLRQAFWSGVVRTTAISGTVILLLVSSVILVFKSWQRADREAEARRHLLYAIDMRSAQSALEQAHYVEAQALIGKQVPSPIDPKKDLRGFEWELLAGWSEGNATSRWPFPTGSFPTVPRVAAFGKDGTLLYSTSDGRIYLAQRKGSAPLSSRMLAGPFAGGAVTVIAPAPNREEALVGTEHGICYLVRYGTTSCSVRALKSAFQQPHDRSITAVAWGEGCQNAVAGYIDGKIEVWNLEVEPQPVPTPFTSSTPLFSSLHRVFDPHRSEPDNEINMCTGVAIVGRKWVISTSRDQYLHVWDLSSGRSIASAKEPDWINAMAVPVSGKTIITASDNSELVLRALPYLKEKRRWHAKDAVLCMAMDSAGRFLGVAENDSSVEVFDLEQASKTPKLQASKASKLLVGARQPALAIGFQSLNPLNRFNQMDDSHAVSVATPDEQLIWSLPPADSQPQSTNLKVPPHGIYATDFSPDNRLLASANFDGKVLLWQYRPEHTPPCSQIASIEAHKGPIDGMRFHPDGGLLATAGEDGRVCVWSVRQPDRQRLVGEFKQNGEAYGVSFSPDGTQLASGGDAGVVNIYDAKPFSRASASITQKPVKTFKIGWPGFKDSVIDLIFSPKPGYPLVVCTGTGRILLFDSHDYTYLGELQGHTKEIEMLAFSHDGKILASASLDRTVRLWDISSRKNIGTIHHGLAVLSVAFTSDDRTLATTSRDGILHLWVVANQQEVLRFGGFDTFPSAVTFSPDAQAMACGTGDYTNTRGSGSMLLWFTGGSRVKR